MSLTEKKSSYKGRFLDETQSVNLCWKKGMFVDKVNKFIEIPFNLKIGIKMLGRLDFLKNLGWHIIKLEKS